MDMDITGDNCQAVPYVVNDRAVVAMVGLDTVRMGRRLRWIVMASVRSGIFTTILKQSTACLFIMW